MGIRRILSSIGSSATDWRVRVAVGFAGTLISVLPTAAMAKSHGPLDRSFGQNGSLHRIFAEGPATVNPIGILPRGDGYRVWAEVQGDLGFFDYRSDGSLDPAVAGRGFQLIEPIATGNNDWDTPHDVVLQGSRQIVAGGTERMSRDWQQLIERQTLTRFMPDGRIDRTFGNRGTAISPDLAPARQVAVDSKGRIVTLAQVPQKARVTSKRFRPAAIQIARYHADGKRDRGFGKDGVVRRSKKWGTRVGALAVDRQGRPLVAVLDSLGKNGKRPLRTGRVMRLKPSGKVDRSFRTLQLPPVHHSERHPRQLLITASGRILLAAADGSEAHVIAFDQQGRLDPAFGANGDAEVDPGRRWATLGEIMGLGALRDGKIAISKAKRLGMLDSHGNPIPVPWTDLPGNGGGPLHVGADGSVITARTSSGAPTPARLLPDLTSDPEFRESAGHPFGLRLSVMDEYDGASGMSDQGFLLVGSQFDGLGWMDANMTRLRPDGSLDPAFGEGGFTNHKVRGAGDVDRVDSILPLPNGDAWALGSRVRAAKAIKVTRNGDLSSVKLKEFRSANFRNAILTPSRGLIAIGVSHRNKEREGFMLARHRADGSLDQRFGHGGVSRSFFPENSGPWAAKFDRKGRIMVAGGTCGEWANCWIPKGTSRMFTVARYLRNGRPDRSFGRRGYMQTKAGTTAGVKSLAMLRDGRIAVSIDGICGPFCFNESRVLMLNRNGSLDRRFGRNGLLTLRLGRSFGVHRILKGGGGDITLAGTLESCSGRPEFSLIRLDRRGRFDRSFGGGDGILDSGVKGGVGSWTGLVSRQKPGTLTLGGYSEVKGRYGGIESSFGMARFRLDGRDGRTPVKPCRK